MSGRRIVRAWTRRCQRDRSEICCASGASGAISASWRWRSTPMSRRATSAFWRLGEPVRAGRWSSGWRSSWRCRCESATRSCSPLATLLLYPEHGLDDPALAVARDAIDRVLAGHEPYPALAVDRHWTLVAANRAVDPLLSGVAPAPVAASDQRPARQSASGWVWRPASPTWRSGASTFWPVCRDRSR